MSMRERECYKEAIVKKKVSRSRGRYRRCSALEEDYEKFGYQQAKRLQLQSDLEYLNEAARNQYVSPLNFAQTYALLNERTRRLSGSKNVIRNVLPG